MKTTKNLIELYCKENIEGFRELTNYFIIGRSLVICFLYGEFREKTEFDIDLLDYMTFLFNLSNKEK